MEIIIPIIISAIALIISFYSAKKSKDILKQTIMDTLLNQRFSNEMLAAKKDLSAYYEEKKDSIIEDFNKIRDSKKGKKIDNHRYFLKSYFFKIFLQKKARLISENDIRLLLGENDIDLFFNKIYWELTSKINITEKKEIKAITKKAKKYQDIEMYYFYNKLLKKLNPPYKQIENK